MQASPDRAYGARVQSDHWLEENIGAVPVGATPWPVRTREHHLNTHTSPGGSGFRVSDFLKLNACVVVIDEDQMRVCLSLASQTSWRVEWSPAEKCAFAGAQALH